MDLLTLSLQCAVNSRSRRSASLDPRVCKGKIAQIVLFDLADDQAIPETPDAKGTVHVGHSDLVHGEIAVHLWCCPIQAALEVFLVSGLGLAARACHMSVAAGPDGPRSGIFEADLAFEHVQNRCIVVGLLS